MNKIFSRYSAFILTSAITLVSSFFISAVSHATQSFTEDFSHETNEGNWTFGPYETQILRDEDAQKNFISLDIRSIWFPVLRTESLENVFIGDYRKTKVTGLSIEAKWFNENFLPIDRGFSLLLVSGKYAAYLVSKDPLESSYLKWHTFNFSIPASSKNLPSTGWKVIPWPVQNDVEEDDSHFEEILQNVEQVHFYYFNPIDWTYLQDYRVGATNITIERGN